MAGPATANAVRGRSLTKPREDDSYRIWESKTINVLLVGRSGTGKSTIVDSLKNEKLFVKSTTGYSDTKEPTCHSCVLQKNYTPAYQLNLLDTPGLKEHRLEQSENRSDDVLMQLAMRCVEQNVTKLNVVCFVSKAGDMYEHDVAPFEKLRAYLGAKFNTNSMIILTHCEQLTQSTIDRYANDIREHPVTKGLADYCELGIFGFGAVNEEHVAEFDEATRSAVLQARHKKTAAMRNTLIESLISCADSPVEVSQLEELARQRHQHLLTLVQEQRRKEDEGRRSTPVTSSSAQSTRDLSYASVNIPITSSSTQYPSRTRPQTRRNDSGLTPRVSTRHNCG